MAIKVTDEVIEQINELYLKLKVKAQVARIIGCSPATVTKYIIPNYVSKANQVDLPPFDMSKITGPKHYEDWNDFFTNCILTEDEWKDMKDIQKEVMI